MSPANLVVVALVAALSGGLTAFVIGVAYALVERRVRRGRW